MREPVIPGWAEEQTPTPFLYYKQNLKQKYNADSVVSIGKMVVIARPFDYIDYSLKK